MLALKKGLSRLEPCVGKLTSTVLRGGRPGNGSLLPDFLLKMIPLLIQGIVQSGRLRELGRLSNSLQ
jgi:hypothetical protein